MLEVVDCGSIVKSRLKCQKRTVDEPKAALVRTLKTFTLTQHYGMALRKSLILVKLHYLNKKTGSILLP